MINLNQETKDNKKLFYSEAETAWEKGRRIEKG